MTDSIIPNEDIIQGAIGANYAKAHRMFGLLLYHWCTHTDDTRSMGSISFDKLITLSSRLWNAIANILGENTTAETLSFLVPHRLLPGKHGPGLGIIAHDEGRPKYIGEILFEHKKLGIQEDIVVKPCEDDFRHEKTTFTTGLTTTMKSGILQRANIFNSTEQTIIDQMAGILCHLNEEEIRALGTHENADQTAEAIIFELDRWEQLINKAMTLYDSITIDDKGRNSLWYSQEAFEYASEAVRKSINNMKTYEEAWNHFTKHTGRSEQTFEAFMKKQQKSSSIWNDPKVKELSIDAKKALSFSKISLAISSSKQSPKATRSTASSKKQNSHIKEGVIAIRELCDLMKNPLQTKLFKGINVQPIEEYLTQQKNIEQAIQSLKNIKQELLDSMSWKNIKKQL